MISPFFVEEDRNRRYRKAKIRKSAADSYSCAGCRVLSSGTGAAKSERKRTPQGRLHSLPQQQPAAKQPNRPTACPSAIPGAKQSMVANSGRDSFLINHAAKTKATIRPPWNTPAACRVASVKISPG